VVRVLLLEARELVEQPADLRRREALVDDTAERRQFLGAPCRPPGRHHRLLVPPEDGARAREVADLGQAPAKLLEGRIHGGEPTELLVVWFANSVARATGVRRYSSWAGPCSSGDGFRPRPSPTVRSVVQRRGRSSSELPLRPAHNGVNAPRAASRPSFDGARRPA